MNAGAELNHSYFGKSKHMKVQEIVTGKTGAHMCSEWENSKPENGKQARKSCNLNSQE